MTDDTPQPQSQEVMAEIHHENFSVVYSNWIQAGRTSWDIALAFGQIGETNPGVPAVVHMVNVVMTPQMAKALIGTLAVTVKQYEKDNGEILLPESVKQRISVSASPSPSVSPSSSASPSAGPSEEEEA